MTKIGLIKLLDRMLGGMLVASLPPPERGAWEAARSLLVIRPGGIGDAVLLVHALRALKAARPGLRIDVLAEQRNAAAFAFTPVIEKVHLYDSLSGIVSAMRGRYDVVIDTEQSYRLSAVVARLSGAQVLVGFGTNERRKLFTDCVPYDETQYEADSFSRLLEPLGIANGCPAESPFLEVPPASSAAAEKVIAPLDGAPFVTIFPGASVPEKQWGAERFRELIDLVRARGLAVVLVGGGDARAVGERLSAGIDVLNLIGRSSLGVTGALVARGRALVTGDSGLLHIAAGLGTPTVSLFGPSDPRKWGPRGGSHMVLSAGVPCAPCSRFGTIPACAHAVRCLSAISVADVFAALEAVLAAGERRV